MEPRHRPLPLPQERCVHTHQEGTGIRNTAICTLPSKDFNFRLFCVYGVWGEHMPQHASRGRLTCSNRFGSLLQDAGPGVQTQVIKLSSKSL